MARTLTKHFSVTIPPGTSQAAPLVTPTPFEPNVVDRVEWTFPSGCNGQVGIQIGARDVTILPSDHGVFFTTSGDSHSVALEEMHTTGDWSVIGYNTGRFPHTIRVVFFVRRIELPYQPPAFWTDSGLSNAAPASWG